MLRLGRRDLDTLAVEPLLAHVAADPELVLPVVVPTRAAQRIAVLFPAATTTGGGSTILTRIQGFILAVFLLQLGLGLLRPRLRGFLLSQRRVQVRRP